MTWLLVATWDLDLGNFYSLSRSVGGTTFVYFTLVATKTNYDRLQTLEGQAGKRGRPDSNLAGFGRKPAGWKCRRDANVSSRGGGIKSQMRWPQPRIFIASAGRARVPRSTCSRKGNPIKRVAGPSCQRGIKIEHYKFKFCRFETGPSGMDAVCDLS